MARDDSLRAKVAEQLTAQSAVGGPLHREAAECTQRRITRKENVVIESTLTWDGQGPKTFRELADSAYTDVEVYGVDIGPAAAHEQALIRWWQGRLDWVNGADQLGGRFIPVDAIDICYPKAGQAVCTSHALQFIDAAQSGEIPHVHVTILRRQTTGALEVADERFYRQ